MSKHWPAPWTWDGTFPIRILDFEGHIVCGDIMPSGEANARLIAAAPKMEDALLAIQSQCAGHSDEFSRRVWQIAEEALAIAKAEGK